MGQEPRQTTSNIGHLQKPSIQALVHGLNRHYYSISIEYRKNELEQMMLMNLHKKARFLILYRLFLLTMIVEME
jgi:26S proteasome regulatory subunit N11